MSPDLEKAGNKTKNNSNKKKESNDSGSNDAVDLISSKIKKFWKNYMKPQGEDGHYTFIHDLIIALVIVLLILGGIYGYTRKWPPVVIVESGSMQHSIDSSQFNAIDTGDIVMVKEINSVDDITTWSQGKEEGYETYGHYGDVIIYDKNGKGGTPVIHRAIVFIKHNETIGGRHYFDVPEWDIYHNETIDYYIQELRTRINYTPRRGHDGYLTKGDNQVTNKEVDQQSGISDATGRTVEQVSVNWVVGVARGELPWFGLIKLKLTNNENIDDAPENSWTNLKLSLFLLLGVPIILNVIHIYFTSKYETQEDIKSREEFRKKEKNGKKLSSRQSKVKLK